MLDEFSIVVIVPKKDAIEIPQEIFQGFRFVRVSCAFAIINALCFIVANNLYLFL